MNRRRAWMRLALAGLGAAGGLRVAADTPPAADPAVAPLEWPAHEVAPGVYRFAGSGEDVTPANRGVVANAACIVGRDSVLVVNSGSSHRQGLAMLASIARLTDRPVRYAVITQQGPEFVFGASALRAAGAALLAHPRTAELIAGFCHICLARLVDTLGEAEMRGSVVTVPEQAVTGDTVIDLGDRRVLLHHPGPASTPGDLVVIDERTSTMVTGGLASLGRIPQLRLEDYAGWIATLTALEQRGAARLIPGFGPVGAPAEALGRTREYLQALDASVRRALMRGMSLSEARASVRLPRFATWQGLESVHVDNVQRRYLALELG